MNDLYSEVPGNDRFCFALAELLHASSCIQCNRAWEKRSTFSYSGVLWCRTAESCISVIGYATPRIKNSRTPSRLCTRGFMFAPIIYNHSDEILLLPYLEMALTRFLLFGVVRLSSHARHMSFLSTNQSALRYTYILPWFCIANVILHSSSHGSVSVIYMNFSSYFNVPEDICILFQFKTVVKRNEFLLRCEKNWMVGRIYYHQCFFFDSCLCDANAW